MSKYSDLTHIQLANPQQNIFYDLECLKREITCLKKELEDQKRYRKSESIHLFEQIKSIEERITKQSAQPTRASISSSKTSIGEIPSVKQHFDTLTTEQDEIVQNPLIRCLSQNRFNLNQPTKVNSNIKQDFSLLMKQFSEFKNGIKLDIAELRDNLSDVDFNLQQCMKTIGSPANMKTLINTVIGIQQKTNNLIISSQKTATDIEFLKDNLDFLSNKVFKIEDDFPETVEKLQSKIALIRQQFDNSQVQLNEYLSRKLNKMIQSYNLNFEDVDKSITEIKQVLVDVVKINKVIKQKIGLRLSNTVDTQTLQKTIDVLNQSFQTTYLINHHRAKEMHQMDYGAQSQLVQIRESLNYLQSGFGYNGNTIQNEYTAECQGQNTIVNLPIQETSRLEIEDSTNKFKKKSKRIERKQSHELKRTQKHRQYKQSDRYQENTENIKSLADQLREFEVQ